MAIKVDIPTRLKQVPIHPGVYLFKNAAGEILYIGKAKNLRVRVRSYFQENKYHTAHTQAMIKRIADLEWIVTSHEVEALLTEANMIKEHSPRYNIDFKDDKSFPYIRITREPFPQVLLTREIIRDGSKYFGPYTNVQLLRKSLKAVHKIFPIRSCSYQLDQESIAVEKVSLCLDYHIKKCGGPCAGIVSEEEYNQMIRRVIQFLHGDTRDTEAYLKTAMERSSGEQNYEDAALFRDQWRAVQSFKARQRKVAADFEDRDVFALARQAELGVVTIIRIRRGRIFSREKYSLQGLDQDDPAVFQSVVTRFYLEGDFIPREVTLPVLPLGWEELRDWLKAKRGRVVKITVPQRGEKAREIRLSTQNAKLLLGEWLLERQKRREAVPGAVRQLQEDLGLRVPPRRIEAFDVSHLGGTGTVAALVCFVDGKPRKSEYRKFKLKTVKGIDDYLAMREVVGRRYRRIKQEQGSFPDLILVDGGRGQLSMAVSALRELGLDYLSVVGLAKRLEEVYLPGLPDPQSIPKRSPGLILLRRIRDEAHRFAITFQRQKRRRGVRGSIFESISGMGPKRIQKLLSRYTLHEIAKERAPLLTKKVGLPEKLGNEIIALAKKQLKN